MNERIYVFKRFERFWHWSQAALIIALMLSGFEVHGSYQFFGFAKAVDIHTFAAWSLVTLWVFAVFWHITTGEWKQYVCQPSKEKMLGMARYYAYGIFVGAENPFKQTEQRKHNPVQRLAYLAFMLVMSPIIWFSGWFYLFHDQWAAWGMDAYLSLEWVAFFHTLGAFMILIFFIAHVYLATAGHTPTSHIKAMITGWEDVH